MKDLFERLYWAKTEDEVDQVISDDPRLHDHRNWEPLGGDANYYGVIENQQSSPVAALIEKITNSIDALLMKECRWAGIDPASDSAPHSMHEAVARFFPNYKNWDQQRARNKQAEEIQILAHGPRRNTSLVIYDNGEGQEPDEFKATFLSLLKGNKKKIRFVQGVYNMGGSGAIVFCGKKRYQLIASRRVDGSGQVGFTLVRKHVKTESDAVRKTWYEYLSFDGSVPSFQSGKLSLGLLNREFDTGSLIKLYSYELPSGVRSVISTDLNQSINEYLFEPALPLYTIDSKERYAEDNYPQRSLYGLKRRLEEQKAEYVDRVLSLEPTTQEFGKIKITCYVFKPKLDGKSVKESRDSIDRLFFKNNMAVMFSVNGQVQGHYTSEFISRTLKFNLLKDFLLIHVDCTEMKEDIREELFMASRDRLKKGDQEQNIRDFLGAQLKESDLDEINRRRKDHIGLEGGDTEELIRSLAKSLPKDSELFKLLSNTLKLEERKKQPEKKSGRDSSPSTKITEPFIGKRFPTIFELQTASGGELPVLHLSEGSEKTVQFNTDVENDFFDRVDEAGELRIALLSIKRNDSSGGDMKGSQTKIEDVLNIVKRSPNNGKIKLSLNPTEQLQVGDEVELMVSLSSSASDIDRLLMVKIEKPEANKQLAPKTVEENDQIGLPKAVPVHQKDWSRLESSGISMDHSTVMFPEATGEILETIYINMDSTVFLKYRSRLNSEEQILLAERSYQASVFFHTLFLYLITKKRGYKLSIPKDGEDTEVDIATYLGDLFGTYYTEFLINFKTEDLLQMVS